VDLVGTYYATIWTGLGYALGLGMNLFRIWTGFWYESDLDMGL